MHIKALHGEASKRNFLLRRVARWSYFAIREMEIVGTVVKLLKTVCFSLVLLVSLIIVCVPWGCAIREQGFVLQAFLILMFFFFRLNGLSKLDSQLPL